MKPDTQDVFFQLIVSGGGEFVYDINGNLRSSNVGQVTTDPLQGITCQPGLTTFNGRGAAITYLSTSLGGFFEYQDLGTSTQGSLIFSVASNSGVEPYDGFTYPAGFFGFDPAFGDNIIGTGGRIQLALLTYTQRGEVTVGGGGGPTLPPFLQIDAPEQTTAQHAQIQMLGASPDGTTKKFGQTVIGNVSGAGVLAPGSDAVLEVQGETGPTDPALQVISAAAGDNSAGVRVTGDAFNRLRVDSNGQMQWGSGAAGQDVTLARASAHLLSLTVADLDIATAGRGLRVAEGANAKQGTAVLAAGTAVVATTAVTANSRIFLTAQTTGAGPGALRVSARTAGTSFTITSTNAADTSTVAWEIFEPG